MRLHVKKPGLLSTIQDLGRWGFQGRGVPVAGAMDPFSLRLGNLLLGNEPGAAAIEITLLGPELVVEGEGFVALTGTDLGMSIDGKPVPAWTVLPVREGCRIGFSGVRGPGARAYLCVAGGIDIPPVMGSRSTYTRAKIGGMEGRALRPGDILPVRAKPDGRGPEAGFSCPEALRFLPDPEAPIRAIPGPQDEAFTEEGLRTFFGSEYRITQEADRMGCRLEGPEIAHRAGADIVSDAIPLGAVQVPGHRKPIVMLADRQTTGGYTKIAVCTAVGTATLAMRLPGAAVRFARSTVEEGVAELRERARMEARLIEAREERRRVLVPGTATPDSRGPGGSASREDASSVTSAIPRPGGTIPAGPTAEGTRAYRITVGGRTYEVTLEEIL